MQRFRIAPTPSGFLHLGNAYNFILTALLARSMNAALRLRIDDNDALRARPEYLADIFETLHWLGIGWEEGPQNVDEHTARFSQSLRAKQYEMLIKKLTETGNVFACICSRKEILAASTDGQYPGTCRNKGLPLDTAGATLRLLTPQSTVISFRDALLGIVSLHPYNVARDSVIRRRDGLAAYHVASLSDDLSYGITHIVRGADLLHSTIVQLFISHVLGGTVFEAVRFFHHPLLADVTGQKLSKSAGSASLYAMRSSGRTAAEVYRYFSAWMHWKSVAESFETATKIFATQQIEGLK